MGSAAQRQQHLPRFGVVGRFAQDRLIQSDGGIGGDDNKPGSVARCRQWLSHGLGLLLGRAQNVACRPGIQVQILVNAGDDNLKRVAQQRQQLPSAGRLRSQNEARVVHGAQRETGLLSKPVSSYRSSSVTKLLNLDDSAGLFQSLLGLGRLFLADGFHDDVQSFDSVLGFLQAQVCLLYTSRTCLVTASASLSSDSL